LRSIKGIAYNDSLQYQTLAISILKTFSLLKTLSKFATVVIISKTTIGAYAKMYPMSAEPLNNWYKIAKRENWSCYADVKHSFNSVDSVGNDRYCFNIKGNGFRLIVLIIFRARTIFVLWFGPHAEYDLLNKKMGAANVSHNTYL
jgi:mRNA interferase HigB